MSLSYDAIGNPTSYYNGASYAMSWEKGRRLSSVTKGGTTTTYAYDMDGIRRSKASGGVTTEFVTQNGLVVRQTNGTVTLDFIYDSQQRPYALIYTNGTAAAQTYYYLLNLQGDVVGLLDSSGNVAARYSYNAWGKLLSVTNDSGTAITSATNIANLNPLRYRSYYYDTETGFYYLQSRYYDPAIGRFINADGQFDADLSNGLNMFSYCGNNPVNRIDPTGHSWSSIWNFIKSATKTVTKTVKTVAKKAVNTVKRTYNKVKAKAAKPINCIWKSLEIDVGIGAGFRGDIGSGISVDAGFSTNVAQLHINDGKVSVVQSATAGVTMDAIYYTVGYRSTKMHDLNWNSVKAPEDTLGFSSGTTTILSVACYLGIGGSVEIAFNWDEFIDYYE